MKERKTFDCVRMKDELQAKLLSDWQGLSDVQIIEKMRIDLDTSGGPLAKLWRRLERSECAESPRSVAGTCQ